MLLVLIDPGFVMFLVYSGPTFPTAFNNQSLSTALIKKEKRDATMDAEGFQFHNSCGSFNNQGTSSPVHCKLQR